MGGRCVRLTRGDFATEKVYSDDPLETARAFEKQGAPLIHVVDLDGARVGRPLNRELIVEIAGAVKTPLQVGGGIRDYDCAAAYLGAGVARVVIGTAIVENPALAERLLKRFGAERAAAAVDIKDGRIATRGWQASDETPVGEFIGRLKALGVKWLAVTDVNRDGMQSGPNFKLARRFVESGFSVIAAGGASALGDIKEFLKIGVDGAILGKALYERKLDLREALDAAKPRNGLAKRIIPCLDVKDGRVVKGKHFVGLREVGDPVALGRRYSDEGADELVFLDIAATLEGRATFARLVADIAAEINIPFTVGGGVASAEHIRALLNAGADKVSIGSAAATDPALVETAARYFGSQCIVISLDAKRSGAGWKVYIKGGSQPTDVDAIEFAGEMERLGAGEILVNSLDRDGTRRGFDLELLQAITATTNLPVIASSGAGSAADFLEVFRETDVDAALGASVFHFGEMSVGELKRHLSERGLAARL